MGDMSEESCNLPLGIILGTNPAKVGVEAESIEERSSSVEALADAPVIRLINNSIEELLRDDIRHRHIVGGWRGLAWARLAARAAVVAAGAAVAPPAAAEVRRATAVLGGGGVNYSSKEEGEE